MFSIDGLVSGLDTTSIIESLVQLQSQQVDRLNVRKNEILTQQTAFQGIEARLLSFRGSLSQLNRNSSSVFDNATGTSSHENILTVDAGNGAAEGVYSVRVTSLAKAQQLGSQSISTGSTVSHGTLSFQVGNRAATEITVDSSNDSLSGLVAAINAQSDDVSASIVKDQATNANRILITSNYTGTANQITITNNLAASSGTAVQPDFSGTPVQEAANATIQLGSGAGAISAEYSGNEVDDLIDNVTLNLQSVDVDTDVTIRVERDKEGATEAIRNFVDEYNSLIEYIDEQTSYNADTNIASPLIGNRSVTNLKNNLLSLVTNVISGLPGKLNRLTQVGVSINTQGKLGIDSAKLDQALSGELEDIDPADIKRLFALGGTSDTAGIEFILGSSRTNADAGTIEVDILQAAERGTVTATNSLASSVTVTAGSEGFSFSVDGQTVENLTLTAGTYTQQDFADHVQSVINSSSSLAAQNVSVELDGDKLKFTSGSYGLASKIESFGGTALATLGLTGSEAGQGQDVAGNFIVNGQTESATGTGRVLIGNSDNENTADLQLRITLGASSITTGVEGQLTLSRGITSQLDQYFANLLDPDFGTIKTANEDFDLRIESLDASIERVNQISEAKTQYLIEQFAALERVLSDLQSTSSFLGSQLQSLGQQ